jgi:hypothetical protein
MGVRTGRQLGRIASVLALLVTLKLQPAVADGQTDAVQALQATLQEYRGLIAQISPDYLPGRMAGYPQTAEQLEKLGETLELLSRRAVALERDGGDWTGLAADISILRDDLAELRRSSTVLRAYSHCIRAGIKRPRWAVAQVPSDSFVVPEVEQFDGNFSRYVRLQAIPGELLEVADTGGLVGLVACAGEYRKQYRRQDRDDGYDHQKFYEREASVSSHCIPSSRNYGSNRRCNARFVHTE